MSIRASTRISIARAISLILGTATAQLAVAQENTELEEVVVTGIRGSLTSSMELKRDAQGVMDGIVAEDIGKFPDTNLAESMQRVSGVSIDRSLGEGSRVTVRGVGPDFNLILLNGRQMPASAVADTGAANTRAFDFANLASESISAIEVYKTSRASTPTGGIGATINIKTARPLDNPGMHSSFGAKGVIDTSVDNLPDGLQGDTITPEVSGIFSNTFGGDKFGVAISASYQERDFGFNQASVGNGWRTFAGDENNWGTIPQAGAPGSERIVNRPDATDTYSVPQNLGYSVNGVERKRTNGQLTLQYAPTDSVTTTLDYTYSENKIATQRNELSVWFNFGPSASTWTDGPVASPLIYSETIVPANSDLSMGGARFATKNENNSVGFNVDWDVSDNFGLTFDFHDSSAESGADSPYGSNAVLGVAGFYRGTTTADFSRDFPVMSVALPPGQAGIDASQMKVTGSSFRNSYMRSDIQQAQVNGHLDFFEESRLDFGVGWTEAKNRSAYSNVQRDTWSDAASISAAAFPDNVWRADTVRHYFDNISGSSGPALFNNFFTFDFETVRGLAAQAINNEALYRASPVFTTDRRTEEESKSAFVQYSQEWEWGLPMQGAVGLRYEKTDVTSRALVPTPTGIVWVADNEFSLVLPEGLSSFEQLKGDYDYVLPSLDFAVDLTDSIKARASYGESIGRPLWDQIQGGRTLNQLVRINGGTGAQGNPALQPLESENFDFSVEWYYSDSSYLSVGYFRKNIDNYIGTVVEQQTPYSLNTPSGGAYYQEAVASGCTTPGCIRQFILNNHAGDPGVTVERRDADGNAIGTIAGLPGDPVATFDITVPSNQRSASLDGWEFNIQHLFGDTGFGVSANYTLVDSGLTYDNYNRKDQFALLGLSDAANLVAFYENEKFQVRAAYNWRDEFLASTFDGSGSPNPVYTEAYGQLDFNASYNWDENLTLMLEAINLTDEIYRQHGRTDHQLIMVQQTGPRYMIGARYKFGE